MLDEAGFEGRHIIQLSSHKNEATIKEYSTKCPENKHKEMFDSLSNAMLPKCKKPKKSNPTSTVTKQQDNLQVKDVKENLPNFDLQQIDDFNTIDDSVLAEIILDAETLTANSDVTDKDTTGKTLVAPTQNVQNIQAQFNSITNNSPYPRMPALYFPNPNVTINCNFGK